MFRLVLLLMVLASAKAENAETSPTLRLELTWGYRFSTKRPFWVKLTGNNVTIVDAKLEQTELEDKLAGGVARTRAGAGDVDRLSCRKAMPPIAHY